MTVPPQSALSPLPPAALPRRRLLLSGLAAALDAMGATARAEPQLSAAAPMRFPRDHGSHCDADTEWWYVTGHASAQDRLFGFQVTFFRSRVEATQQMTSKFAARQLLFAHAAVCDVRAKRLLHDQRIARAGFGVAEASADDAAIRLRDWSLDRAAGVADGPWRTTVVSQEFALELTFAPTQPVLLQGVRGVSRKGPLPDNVSRYYSQPQLAVGGRLRVGRSWFELPPRAAADAVGYPLAASAWLDREWSSAYLHPDAVGWDWIGMNLDDGAALMAFRIRRRDGGVLWDGGSFRPAGGVPRVFERGETRWQPLRRWTSAASGAVYPVEWKLRTPVGTFDVRALVDSQELDSRGSTGAIYWEGLSDLLAAGGRRAGRGYLEMTGYAAALRL